MRATTTLILPLQIAREFGMEINIGVGTQHNYGLIG